MKSCHGLFAAHANDNTVRDPKNTFFYDITFAVITFFVHQKIFIS